MPRSHPQDTESDPRRDGTDPLLDDVREILADVLEIRGAQLAEISPDSRHLVDVLDSFLAGGKLLRPRFCVTGALAVSTPDAAQAWAVASLAASLELVQAAALLHDDVIDHSLTRRGRPAVHVAEAAEHRRRQLDGSAEDHGAAVAILLGDLALTWADQLVADATAPLGVPGADARAEYGRLCTEVMAGQHLDVIHQAGALSSPADPEAAALRVIRFKTVPYTVLRPLQMGSALMGADARLREVLAVYAVEIGTAFQLRDDLLGVLGDEELTGKPAADDIREGKRTVLLARARRRADPEQLKTLDRVVGAEHPTGEDLEAVREILRATGSAASIAEEIRERAALGLAALDSATTMTEVGRSGLIELAEATTRLDGLGL